MKYFNIFIFFTSIFIIFFSILKPYSIFTDPHQIDTEYEDMVVKPFDYQLYNDPLNQLDNCKYVSLGDTYGPESMVFSKSGDRLYFPLKNGEIRYLETPLNILSKDEFLKSNITLTTSKLLCHVGRGLGIEVDSDDNLIIADAVKGLLKYDLRKQELIILTSTANNKKLNFIDDISISKLDGTIYFSNSMKLAPFLDKTGDYNTLIPSLYSSYAYAKTGQILSYNPKTKETKVLLEGLAFSNGVALDENEESIFVAESSGARVTRYWIKGKNQGKHEIFIDNLPGFPDGVNIVNNKLYISIFNNRTPLSDMLSPFTNLKKLLIRIPYFSIPITKPSFIIVDIDTGKVLNYYSTSSSSLIHTITSSIVKDGKIYLGNLNNNYFIIIEDNKIKIN